MSGAASPDIACSIASSHCQQLSTQKIGRPAVLLQEAGVRLDQIYPAHCPAHYLGAPAHRQAPRSKLSVLYLDWLPPMNLTTSSESASVRVLITDGCELTNGHHIIGFGPESLHADSMLNSDILEFDPLVVCVLERGYRVYRSVVRISLALRLRYTSVPKLTSGRDIKS